MAAVSVSTSQRAFDDVCEADGAGARGFRLDGNGEEDISRDGHREDFIERVINVLRTRSVQAQENA